MSWKPYSEDTSIFDLNHPNSISDFLKTFLETLEKKVSKISEKEGDKHLLLQIAEDFEDLNMVNQFFFQIVYICLNF